MSDMEIFYGTFKKSNLKMELDYTDERYDLEDEMECILVDIDGQIYEAREVDEIDPCGFTLVIPPSDDPRFMCYWYNGGAGVHEVIENAIRSYILAGGE